MDKKEILEAFDRLSPEDQAEVKAEILGRGAEQKAGVGCMPPEMVEHMKSMMESMKAGKNPMAACCEAMSRPEPEKGAARCC